MGFLLCLNFCHTETMEKNNAFKTSLLFLGIIFIVIILRTYFVEKSLSEIRASEMQSVASPCIDGRVNC